MTVRVDRPSEWLTIGDHEERIRIIEALDSGSGGLVVCTGCYEVPPEYAACVDLVAGTCMDVASSVLQTAEFSFIPVDDAVFVDIGPYKCNYGAGFRLQVRYAGEFDSSLQAHIGFGTEANGALPPSGNFDGFDFPNLGVGNSGLVDSGWVTYSYDPSADPADDGDPWQLWLGYYNTSVLFAGNVGAPGSFCFRYVNVRDEPPIPTSLVEGQILISVGTPPVWVLLDPGTVGQVLTMGASLPEWA